MRLSSKKKKGFELADNLADAICFLVVEKSYDLVRLRELDLASFMVLLDFVVEQADKMSREMKKIKKPRKH